jgi:hypothetical protein
MIKENFDNQEFECYMQEIEYPKSRFRRDYNEKKWVLVTMPRACIPECVPRSTGRYRLVKVKVIETLDRIPFISNDKELKQSQQLEEVWDRRIKFVDKKIKERELKE